MPLDKIYRHQQVPFLALVLVVTRVRSSTLPHLFPDQNPISLFVTILHAPHPTSFTAFLAVNVANFTSVKRHLSDRFAEHLRSVRNNDVDNPVSRHFNAANHSISDMKICATSHPFLVVMIAVKNTKSISFLKLEPFIPTGLMRDFLLFDHISS